MVLIIMWISFSLLMIFSKDLDKSHYILFSGSMFYFTYLSNKINLHRPTFRQLKFFLIIPNFIFWYIAFVYNDFLSLTPISNKFFVILFFIYTYVFIYLFKDR